MEENAVSVIISYADSRLRRINLLLQAAYRCPCINLVGGVLGIMTDDSTTTILLSEMKEIIKNSDSFDPKNINTVYLRVLVHSSCAFAESERSRPARELFNLLAEKIRQIIEGEKELNKIRKIVLYPLVDTQNSVGSEWSILSGAENDLLEIVLGIGNLVQV